MPDAPQTIQHDPEWLVSIEMGLSHREFFRILPKAYAGVEYTVAERLVRFEDAEKSVEIRLSEEWPVQLGPSLVLPRTQVDFAFFGHSEAEREAFLWHFKMHYFRGGG